MARITPTSGGNYENLVEGDWYNVTLDSVDVKQAPYEPGKPKTTVFKFTVEGHPEAERLFVFATNSLNDAPGGKPNKLRSILNALAGRPNATPIREVDDGTLATDYEDGSTWKPQAGQKIQARGAHTDKGFRLEGFRAVLGQEAAPAVATARPATAAPF